MPRKVREISPLDLAELVTRPLTDVERRSIKCRACEQPCTEPPLCTTCAVHALLVLGEHVLALVADRRLDALPDIPTPPRTWPTRPSFRRK